MTASSDSGARSHALHWAMLIGAGFAWGATFTLIKIATDNGAHPIGLNFWQALIAAACMAIFALARRRRVPLSRRHLIFYAICGVIGTALPGALYFFASRHVSAGVMSITVASVPILTLAIAIAFRIEKPAPSRLAGVLLGIGGVALLTGPGVSDTPGADPPFWVFIALICALSYAIENVYIALRMPPDIDALTVLTGMMSASAILTMAAVLIFDAGFTPAWPPTRVEWALLGSSLINVMSYAAFIYLVTSAGPVFASQIAYLVTFSGVAWGMMAFGESHTIWIWLSLLMMTIGLTLVRPRDPNSEADPAAARRP